jgi:RNA polymerase sigma factor for flagellar operon FliA
MSDMEKLDQVELDKAWITFNESRTLESRNSLVVHYTAALVRGVVSRVASHLPVDREELISYGVFGLIDALDKYDPARIVKFETYAATRIRGAIFDEIRAMDWAPRTMRARARAIDSAEDDLRVELGRMPSEAELAEHLGLGVADLAHTRSQVNSATVASLDIDFSMSNETSGEGFGAMPALGASPDGQVEANEVVDLIAGAIDKLPQRSKTILVLYYIYEMTLSEIGEVLGVTESRVCQLQSRLLQALQAALSGELAAA